VSTVKTRSAEATPFTAGRGRAFAIRKKPQLLGPFYKSSSGPEIRLSDKDGVLAIVVVINWLQAV
jgi:hypothetical protein